MKSTSQYSTVPRMLPLLLCVTLFCIALRPASAHYSPEDVLKKCTFDYSSKSKFQMEAKNSFLHGKWVYSFNVKDQKVIISRNENGFHDPAVEMFTLRQGKFDYKKNTVELSCQNLMKPNRVKKELNESLALPTTFPPPDTVYCGENGLHGRLASLYVYYSKKYDLSFTIGLTVGELEKEKLGTCKIDAFGLPGQKKDGYECFESDETKKLWAVESFPKCAT